jgi:hypothetical protein
MHEGICQVQLVTFPGSQATDGWTFDLATFPQEVYGGLFPGTDTWLQDMVANVSRSQLGVLTKVSNGEGGGPYPLKNINGEDVLYFGGYSPYANTFGGIIKLSVTPLPSVKKIVLQVQICQAFGYDFYVPYGTPALTINSISASVDPEVRMTQHDPIGNVGPSSSAEYKNTYRYEWDVSLIQVPITKVEIQMSAVQHAQIYALQVDQGGVATNPTYPPPLKILSVGPVSYQDNKTSVSVTFQGESGRSYVMDYNEGLTSSGWSSNGASVNTGSNGTFTHTFQTTGDHQVAWQRQLFFRARWP